MKRIKFQLKTIFKNKFNYIPLILLVGIITALLFINANAIKSQGIEAIENSGIALVKPMINQLEAALNDKSLSSSQKKDTQSAIDANKQNMELSQSILKALAAKNLKAAYPLLLEQAKNTQQALENSTTSPEERHALEYNVLLYQALSERNVPYQLPDQPTSGASYTIGILKDVIPMLLSLSLIFILASLFTEPFKDHINRDLLLPRSKINLMTTSLGTGTLVSTAMLVGLLLFTYLLAALSFGAGNWNYPIVSYHLSNQAMFFQNLSNIVAPSLILQVLALVFIVCTVYLICYLLRDRLASLFVSILVIVGTMFATEVLKALQTIAQYLPTSYINAASVTTGEYAYDLSNYSVSFSHGVIVLLVSIVVLLGATVLLARYAKKY